MEEKKRIDQAIIELKKIFHENDFTQGSKFPNAGSQILKIFILIDEHENWKCLSYVNQLNEVVHGTLKTIKQNCHASIFLASFANALISYVKYKNGENEGNECAIFLVSLLKDIECDKIRRHLKKEFEELRRFYDGNKLSLPKFRLDTTLSAFYHSQDDSDRMASDLWQELLKGNKIEEEKKIKSFCNSFPDWCFNICCNKLLHINNLYGKEAIDINHHTIDECRQISKLIMSERDRNCPSSLVVGDVGSVGLESRPQLL